MAVSVVPALIDAIITNARTALPSANVYDGFGVTDNPGDFLMVGVSDPDINGADNAAEGQQDWVTTGQQGARSERGEVTCVALSWNGYGDAKAARDAAYAMVAQVETFCRNDPDLGVPTVLWNSALSSSQLLQNQDSGGALAMVIFRIAFTARI